MNFRKNIIASKRLFIAGALGCVAISLPLLLAACGDDSSSGSANNGDETAEDFMFTLEELEEMGVPIFESANELEKKTCGNENEFETVYVKADSSFYMCYNGEWDNDFSGDNFTIEIPVVDSEDDLGECGEENDGEMFRVPRDTIYDTYACEDGEWVSDFGGNSGEPVDPKTVVKGTFTDERDGKTYKTIKIGKQTWMAENLNYKVSNSFCYEGKAENCKKYGRLYRYDAAKEACPDGWKRPSKLAWQKLLGTSFPESIMKEHVPGMIDGVAGYGVKFESVIGLDDDPYGFNILPAGYARNASKFTQGSKIAYFWTSTLGPAKFGGLSSLLIFTFAPNASYLSINPLASFAYSVRCIKK